LCIVTTGVCFGGAARTAILPASLKNLALNIIRTQIWTLGRGGKDEHERV